MLETWQLRLANLVKLRVRRSSEVPAGILVLVELRAVRGPDSGVALLRNGVDSDGMALQPVLAPPGALRAEAACGGLHPARVGPTNDDVKENLSRKQVGNPVTAYQVIAWRFASDSAAV